MPPSGKVTVPTHSSNGDYLCSDCFSVSQCSTFRWCPLRVCQIPRTECLAGSEGKFQGGGPGLRPPQHHCQHGPVPNCLLRPRLDLPAHLQTPAGKRRCSETPFLQISRGRNLKLTLFLSDADARYTNEVHPF